MAMDFNKIDKKWQHRWEKEKAFEVKKGKYKYYVLEMFPYPSGSGLHVGHAFNYTLGDIFTRFKRMQNYNVLHPMGYDALGLPAENAAIKNNEHPKEHIKKAINYFSKQQKALGLSYDWTRMVNTSNPEYFKWDQWIFLKMFERGLAYKKKSPVNYCPKCKTVLANEQVHNGKCEYHSDTDVEVRHLEQWYFKITDYVDELNDFSKLEKWPLLIKKLQKNWIGKSKGIEIDFEIDKGIKNCIIIHGSPSKDRTKEKDYVPNNLEHWIPWLKDKLEEKGIEVKNPEMPTPWAPKYEEWKKIMDRFDINEGSVLIGHSAGGAFLVKWLNETGKKIKKLILVSPGKEGNESNEVLSDFYKIKSKKDITKNIEEISIFTADDDIDYHIPNAYKYKEELNGKLIHLGEGYGHFCEKQMGTKEFPELLNEVIEIWPI
ncbi:MAG: class I tRNA ligase family protein, partial [Candidatus Nanoarchaeia archaeon]